MRARYAKCVQVGRSANVRLVKLKSSTEHMLSSDHSWLETQKCDHFTWSEIIIIIFFF